MKQNLITFNYSAEKNTLYCVWLETTLIAEWNEMQVAMSEYINAHDEHKAKNIIVDERLLKYIWIDENYEWIDTHIMPRLAATNLEKLAIVQSKSIVYALAVEMMMENLNANSFNTQYFSNVEEAEEWIAE